MQVYRMKTNSNQNQPQLFCLLSRSNRKQEYQLESNGVFLIANAIDSKPLERAWKLVKTTTVVNIQKKGGFIPREDAALIDIGIPEDIQKAAEFWEGVLSITVLKWPTWPPSISQSIKTLFSQSPLGNQHIFHMLDDDDTDEVEEVMTPKEMRIALEALKRGFFQKYLTVQRFDVNRGS